MKKKSKGFGTGGKHTTLFEYLADDNDDEEEEQDDNDEGEKWKGEERETMMKSLSLNFLVVTKGMSRTRKREGEREGRERRVKHSIKQHL
jgi:hypothetical protein